MSTTSRSDESDVLVLPKKPPSTHAGGVRSRMLKHHFSRMKQHLVTSSP